MKKRVRLNRKNVLNKYEPHSYPKLCRTCEATAPPKVHVLHSIGEHELVDGACGREGKERKKDKVRKEEACAAEPPKLFK